jgi:hypothetical protein
MKEFLIAFALVVITASLIKTCSPETVTVETVTKRDTVYLTPDTVILESIVEVLKTTSVVKEVPVPVYVNDTLVYNYTSHRLFEDKVIVFDTISVVDSKITDHKQQVILMDNIVTKEITIEKPFVVTDSITLIKYIMPKDYGLSAGASVINGAIVPTLKGNYKRHNVGFGFNGNTTLFQYTFKIL